MIISIISLLVTILIYLAAGVVYQTRKSVVFSPLLICPALIITGLSVLNISYEAYNSGAQLLTQMMKPAIVAFAVPLYRYFDTLKRYITELVIGTFGGVVLAVLSTVLYAKLANINPQITGDLALRSITTPLAVLISQIMGGIPTMAAVFVIMTGLSSIIVGPLINKILHKQSKVAQGVMLGLSAHGTGTAKAFELGKLEGTMATLAMVLAGLMTFIVAPLLIPSLIRVLY